METILKRLKAPFPLYLNDSTLFKLCLGANKHKLNAPLYTLKTYFNTWRRLVRHKNMETSLKMFYPRNST